MSQLNIAQQFFGHHLQPSSKLDIYQGVIPNSQSSVIHRITIFNLKFSMDIYDISYDISMAPTDYIKLLQMVTGVPVLALRPSVAAGWLPEPMTDPWCCYIWQHGSHQYTPNVSIYTYIYTIFGSYGPKKELWFAGKSIDS